MGRGITACALLIYTTSSAQAVKPLPNAHAHNDYRHKRPLLDALENGFTSIEVDIHLVDGELYVAHDKPASKNPNKTLRAMYLDPLVDIVSKNNGKVYPGYEGDFYLMIDFKTNGSATYSVLKEQLETCKEILTSYNGDKVTKRAVTIFISGSRPFDEVLKENNKLVAVDGRPTDLGKGYSAAFMPVVSDSYKNHFGWKGNGEMTDEEKDHLEEMVYLVHQEGKKLRLWASPENLEVWKVLKAAGVDFINTDKLEELKAFLVMDKK